MQFELSITLVVDSIDRHLDGGNSIESAAVIPGIFIAWCVNMGLVNPAEFVDVERAVVRLKYREITGGEFLVAALGGEFREEHLSNNGVIFARRWYAPFVEEASVRLGEMPEPKWSTYEQMSPWLTERLLGRKSGRKKWWRFWS